MEAAGTGNRSKPGAAIADRITFECAKRNCRIHLSESFAIGSACTTAI